MSSKSSEGKFVQLADVRLHYIEAGPSDGPPMLLLHGFPEGWLAWRKEIEPLASRGFHVVAPDQRGYGSSGKPLGLAAYRLERLAGDVSELVSALGLKNVTLVGHDWGGVVAWCVASRRPPWLGRLAILNAPHPWTSQQELRRNPRQMLRSWYVAAVQLPRIPELLLSRSGWRPLEQSMLGTGRHGAFSRDDMARYRAAWSQPGALTAMLGWYRALARFHWRGLRPFRVSAPTLLLWGARDKFLRRELATESMELCDRGELVFFEEATHWVQHEEPERVTEMLTAFASRPA